MRRRIAFLVAFFMIAALISGVTSAPATAHQVVTSVPTAGGGDPDNYNSDKRPVKKPSIVGNMTVGSVLKVDPGVWKPKPYFWFARWYKVLPDGSLKYLTKKPTYKIKTADRGSKIVVLVIAAHQNYGGQAYSKPRLVK